jgi:hypothetical protein
MAFRKLLFNRVASDEGFRVKIRAFQGFVEYREGQKTAHVPVEPVIGKPLVHVYKDTPITWDPPHSTESIAEDKRTEILKKIVAAMRFRKYAVELV